MRSIRRFLAALALVVLALPLCAQELTGTDALVKLCEVWSTAKYLDPQMMLRDVDWDAALVRAIPKVREAKTHDQLAAAIGSMLAELNDPLTRMVKVAKQEPTNADVPLFRRDGEVLILNLGPYGDAKGAYSLYRINPQVAPEIDKSRMLVVDLRSKSAEVAETVAYAFGNLPGLVVENVPGIAGHIAFHSGYAPHFGSTSGGYYSGLLTIAGDPVTKGRGTNTTAPRIVVVTTGQYVPDKAVALWRAGKASIVSEAPINEALLGGTRDIEIGGGWSAAVRTVDAIAPDAAADRIATGEAAMAAALEIARASTPFPVRTAAAPPAVVPQLRKDKPYVEMTAPDLPHRLLALFRLWSIIDRFYPYRHLISDWDAALREMIPRFEEAEGEKAYTQAVLEAVARVEDGHSGAWGPPTEKYLGGMFSANIEVRSVEGQYAVTSVGADVKDLKPGDIVVSVDGEPLADRVKRLHAIVTASTPEARLNKVLGFSLLGAKDVPAEIGVRGADGSTRVVKVPRVQFYDRNAGLTGDPWRVLDGNIGYVDLTRLTVPQVDPMFDALKDTKAIIFDMRGYPNGTAWTIAPRINTNNAKVGAAFRRTQPSGWSNEEGASGFFFEQPLPKTDKPKYTKPTVMLIDDRAISQSEHSGLFYEAANGTKFIGTNSAGANGDITNFTLPGGFRVIFTGHDVRHADGRQLQRVGLEPHVRVAPTLRGLREGKDEVLERAVRYVNEGR